MLRRGLPPPPVRNGVITPTATLANKSFFVLAFKIKTSQKILGYKFCAKEYFPATKKAYTELATP